MNYQGIQTDRGYMGDRRRGASMGRADTRDDTETSQRFYLRAMPINSGGYDAGGTYWGLGGEMFHYQSEDGKETGTLRIYPRDRAAAFEARAGVRIGEPGYDEFAVSFPRWHATGSREAAKDAVLETYPNARFFI